MTGVLKVYGFTAMNPHTNPKVKGAQVRVIIAAKSVAELTRITGVSRRDYAWSGSVTANDDECAQALAEPGVAYMRGLNDTRALWVEYRKQAKGEPMGTPRGRVTAKPLDRPIVEPKIPLGAVDPNRLTERELQIAREAFLSGVRAGQASVTTESDGGYTWLGVEAVENPYGGAGTRRNANGRTV